MTIEINNRLSKGSSVTLKAAEDRSCESNNFIRDKESLVQDITADTLYITDNRLQLRRKEKKRQKRRRIGGE